MAEVDLEIRLRTAKTIAEIEAVKKQALSLSKNLVLGTKEQEAAERALVATKQRLEDINGRLATTNGKLMKSYFNLGEEYRRFLHDQRLGDRAMSDASRTVQSFTSILGGTEISNAFNSVINNFQTTETTINAMGLAAQTAGGKMAGLGQAVISMGTAAVGPLAAMVTEVMILNGLLDKSREIANRFEGARLKKGKTNKREQDLKRLKNIKSLTFGVESGLLGDILGSGASGFGTMLQGIKALDIASLREDIEGDIQPGTYLEDGVSTVGTVLGEVTSTGTRGGKSVNPFAGRDTRIGAMTMRGFNGFRSAVTPGDRIKMGVQSVDLASVETRVEGINENVKTIGTTLANSLAEGFTRGFQTGENMLQTFAQSVLASIMGIAAQQTAILGISGILSLIPGVGSLGAIAGAMGSMFFNTSSGASASPISGVDVTNGRAGMQGELRGIKSAVQNLSLRVDNQGIYMASVRGEAAFTRA